jgi:hypothetical protein
MLLELCALLNELPVGMQVNAREIETAGTLDVATQGRTLKTSNAYFTWQNKSVKKGKKQPVKAPAPTGGKCGGTCCGDEDCPVGQWCLENKTCGTKCGMLGTDCCNKKDCVGNELSCDTSSYKCVKAVAKAQCGTKDNDCCNGTDCIGNDLICEAKWKKCMTKPVIAPKTTCGDCCGDEDCPAGQWCLENKTCGTKCGMEGTECCNGKDCVGNHLFCEVQWKKCMKY